MKRGVKMRSNSFAAYKDNAMKDPEFAKAYNELEPQYQVIRELIKYRIENNISQQELAIRTGISKSNISRFESGKHSPSLKMIYRIAEGLGKKVTFKLN
jgi:DNA-binding XRE family transcriptional regulator